MTKIEKLEPVLGSTNCEYSVIENKLAMIYRNQRRIYTLLTLIATAVGFNTKMVKATKKKEETSWDEEEEIDEEFDDLEE